MNRKTSQGFVLYLAIVISLLTMLWAVAAVHRVQSQSAANLHGYRKSEAYFLAKQAASRSLAKINASPDWLEIHSTRAQADKTTPGAAAWAIQGEGTVTLAVEADLEGKKHSLKIPLLRLDDPSSKLFSLSPSLDGPDVISWATTEAGVWEGLPPLPGAETIACLTVTDSGDVYAISDFDETSILWRYRLGQGWLQMPDLPSGLQLQQISSGGDSVLVGKASDNSLLRLPLAGKEEVTMTWETIPAPSGAVLDRVKADPRGTGVTYVTSYIDGTPAFYLNEGDTWQQHALPFQITNLAGGLTVDTSGKVYLASNSSAPGVPATILRREANSPGIAAEEWRALPPVPAIEWVDGDARNPRGFLDVITRIEADPSDGSLWVQWDSEGSSNQHNLIKVPTP